MLTMLLGGLWHGASWTFVVWGGIHGTGLAVEHAGDARRKRRGLPPYNPHGARRWLARFITFQIVCIAWVFFRATSFSNAWAMFESIFTELGHGLAAGDLECARRDHRGDWSSICAAGVSGAAD